jgi:uncharacterized protein YecA (UPF0149 family)
MAIYLNRIGYDLAGGQELGSARKWRSVVVQACIALRRASGFVCSSQSQRGVKMENDTAELDHMRSAYKTAVEEWIDAIKQEEALASVDHSIADVDRWEQAHFKEDELRNKVKAAKKRYEDALRKKFYAF